MRRGLTKIQIISIALLWVALCVMIFAIPTDASLGENIFIAIASGIIIAVAVGKGSAPRRRR